MDFTNKLSAAWGKNNSLVCVGLDPDVSKMPAAFSGQEEPLYNFNKAIIDATADLVCAFKPNTAFYEAYGSDGINQLKQTIDYVQEKYPELPVIIDAKRADIGNTNTGTVKYIFEYLGADAVTVNPYMGKDALEPFLELADRGIIIMCRNSNPGAGEFQDLLIDGKPLYQHVAQHVADSWNNNKNCCLVVGATYPNEIKEVRKIVGDDMVLLVPGIGTQGGDTEQSVRTAINSVGNGLIIHTSRSVLYASGGEDFADSARKAALQLRDRVNEYRS